MKTVVVRTKGSAADLIAALQRESEPMNLLTNVRAPGGKGIAVLIRGPYVRIKALPVPGDASRGGRIAPMLYAVIDERNGTAELRGRFWPAPVAGLFSLLVLLGALIGGAFEYYWFRTREGMAVLPAVLRSFSIFAFLAAIVAGMIWFRFDERDLVVYFLENTFGSENVAYR